MSEISLVFLLVMLLLLIVLSGFFSGSETGMMSLNRYRLRHLARKGHRSARRVANMLERPDRLLGVILIGNTFANILASALATLIAIRLFGDIGIFVATITLTLIILIFAEVTPKTFAAIYPQRVAFFASIPLKMLLKFLYPFVWLATTIANGLLLVFRVKPKGLVEPLTRDELRTVVHEAGEMIDVDHQAMLLRILDLKEVQIEDIMIPRNEIVGVDIEDDWETILKQLTGSGHTSLPVYHGSIERVCGIIQLSDIVSLLSEGRLSKDTLLQSCHKAYFIPEGTSASSQLLNFKKNKYRSGLVVDEYGDIQGLVTMEDILEEIVGGLSLRIPGNGAAVHKHKKGGYVIDGGANIRDLNRQMGWHLPTDGPKTLSGLIIERLETIPKRGDVIVIDGYCIEVVVIKENTVKVALLRMSHP